MVKEVIHEVNTTPKWEDLMPLYFEILGKKPKGKGQQELLDLVKEECMRAARMMDRSVDYGVLPSQAPAVDPAFPAAEIDTLLIPIRPELN